MRKCKNAAESENNKTHDFRYGPCTHPHARLRGRERKEYCRQPGMFHASYFHCENMEELKKEFLDFAFAFYEQYADDYGKAFPVAPCLRLPLSYLAFAKEEPHLFRLLFVDAMELDMKAADDFYRELGNEKKAREFSGLLGLEPVRGREIFLDLFLYSHGMAVLMAAGKLSWSLKEAEMRLENFLDAMISQEKEMEKHDEPVSD